MELENTLLQTTRSFLGINFRINRTKITPEKKKEINELIEISDGIHHLSSVKIVLETQVDPRNNGSEKRIYVPLKYSEKEDNIFNTLKRYFGNSFQEIVIFHEMGHAVENDRKPDLAFIDIKNFSELNYLFNGASVPNKVNNFLKEIIKEGYADCYSGLCYYKKYGDINVFEKISEAREIRYNEMKGKDENYIHPNFNTEAPRIFKTIIENLNNNRIDILKLPYVLNQDNIEKYLEEAVIKGCITALVKELENNDAFLNHFRRFANDFAQESNGKYKINQYDESIKDYAQRNSKVLKEVVEDLNKNSLLPYFIEFQTRANKDYIPQKLVDELIDNPKFKRQIDPTLQLMDVIDIPYSAGIERKLDVISKSKVTLNIENIRKSALSMKSDNTHTLKR